MSVLGVLLEGFDPGEMRDPMGRWVRGATSPRHGSFKIGDHVTFKMGSRGPGGHGPVTFTQQPGVHEVVGFQRNGNLRLREPRFGTTVDVHHTQAQKDETTTRLATGTRQQSASADRARGVLDTLGIGSEGRSARDRGASSLTTEAADTRDKLAALPVGQRYGLHGPRGQVGHVERTPAGWDVYTGRETGPTRTHGTAASAASHAMQIQRSASATPNSADVMARNYSATGTVRAMNARQATRAAAERERALEVQARMASSSRERSAAQVELDRLRGARTARPRVRESALGALVEGFAAQQEEPFPDHPFTTGDQVRVAAGNGGKSIVGRVMRPHGGPPATHAVISPEGGGAHVLAPVGQVKLNTPAQHAALARRREQQAAKQAQDKAHAAWLAAKPGGKPPGLVREGVSVLLEAFAPPPAPKETPAQSAAIGARQVAAAQKSLAAGWNASKHPRGQGGKFGYTTGGRSRSKRGTRSSAASSRTLGVGSSGSLVRSIQRQLGIAADGKYGPQTRAAVTRYQQQHRLQIDGVVGRQTLAALRGHANPRLVTPGPISSRAAAVLTHPSQRSSRKAKPVPAPVRIGGGQVV